MLRDLIYRAWMESNNVPSPVKPGPTDIEKPMYNNETGSAPAGDEF